MSKFFLRNQRQDFRAMIEEITEGVKDLRFRDAQRLSNVEDRLAALMQRNNVPDGDAQPVNDRLAPAHAFKPDDVRIFGFRCLGHADSPKSRTLMLSEV